MFFFALWKQIKDQEFNMENLAEEWKVESKDAVNALWCICTLCCILLFYAAAISLVFMAPFAA